MPETTVTHLAQLHKPCFVRIWIQPEVPGDPYDCVTQTGEIEVHLRPYGNENDTSQQWEAIWNPSESCFIFLSKKNAKYLGPNKNGDLQASAGNVGDQEWFKIHTDPIRKHWELAVSAGRGEGGQLLFSDVYKKVDTQSLCSELAARQGTYDNKIQYKPGDSIARVEITLLHD
ncbi:hypothetical protein N7499_008655 [Penicillium canescens]|nr:hypothetical protein N7499_008655 [Penicillium canescens]KAJ6158984.1 hypothetical protein N7485_011810 [Penicillium canescens]